MKTNIQFEKNKSTIKNAIKISDFLKTGRPTSSEFIIADDLRERKGGKLINIDKNIFENVPLKTNFKISKRK